MPWFLNPSIYNNLPVYQNPEVYLFIFKLAATAIFAFLLWKQCVSKLRIIAITYIFFYGTFMTVMLLMHNLVILGLHLFERNDNYSYNFHLYSLILLGTVLFLQGIRSIRAAFQIKTGDENGIRNAKRATWIVLTVSVPLIPIQFFGIVLTVFSLLNLAAIKLFLHRSAVLNKADVKEIFLPASNYGFNR